jgi:tetratricopeptide (TPR) repeat protein
MTQISTDIRHALRPITGQRFDVLIVIDSAPSAEIWQPTVARLCAVLARQGGFRTVRTRRLNCAVTTDDELTLRASGTVRAWQEMLVPGGRQVVLVVTDTIGSGWHSGAVSRLLAKWAARMPVAIVNVLPQRLWTWGALSPRQVRLSAPAPGTPNRRLTVRAAWQDRAPRHTVVVPVLGLEAEWWSGWARLITAAQPAPVATTAIFVSPTDDSTDDPIEPVGDLSPLERTLQFRTFASPDAFRLAGLLAAVPLTLATMRHVRQTLLPASETAVLSEVFLGGILQRTPPAAGSQAATFDFVDGVRQELLAMEWRADTVRAVRALGDPPFDHHLLCNFRDAVDDPEAVPIPESSTTTLPYIRIQEAVFRALSGRYAPRAARLREAIQISVPASQVGTSSAPGGEGVTASGSPQPTEPRRDPASKPQIWGSVPLRNPDFVGRDDLLEQLRQRLFEPGATAVLPEALHGMGGVGKSQTVVEYIYRHAAEYDLIWWIPAEQASQVTSSFVELARRLDLPSGSADVAVWSILDSLRRGQPPFSRWLLVFDNADHPDAVSPFFPASGHIVVTSRNPQWAGVARTVEVDVFTRAESIELLQRHGGALTTEDADRLAEALGDLPLAVEQAAAWRAQTGMQADEYLELLRENPPELLGAEPNSDVGLAGYPRSVAAAWNVPLNRFQTDNPAALQLLQVCAFFGPEPISRALFTGIRAAPVPEALADALNDPMKLNQAIREISRYSLAKIDHRNNTIQLHRLVQTVVKSRLTQAEKEDMRHAVHVLLAHGDPDDPASPTGWVRYAELLPHAMTSKTIHCRKDLWVRRLLLNLVLYLLNRGDFASAENLAREALGLWRDYFGEADKDTLAMARHCGIALRRLGRPQESQALNEQTYELVRRTFGEENELFLSIADALSADMRPQGEFATELEMQQDVYERSSRVLGEDDPDSLKYGNSLAGCLRLNGRFTEARELDQDIWRRRQAVLGEEHPDTFLSLNGLAMDLRECGSWLEACRLQEETLIRQREVIGDDNPKTIGAMRNLAVARRMAGLHERARELSEQCVSRYRRRYGDRHLNTITAEMSLSADLRRLDELAESEKVGAHSHQLFVRTHGPRHPYTLISAINLAITYRLMGEVHKAYELDQVTLAQLRVKFGDRHPFTLVSSTNTASDLAALGENTAAYEMDVLTHNRSDEVLGPNHPSTLAVALNLSVDLAELGRTDEGAILHARTVTTLRRILSDDHPATAAAVRSIRANCDTDTMQL